MTDFQRESTEHFETLDELSERGKVVPEALDVVGRVFDALDAGTDEHALRRADQLLRHAVHRGVAPSALVRAGILLGRQAQSS